MPAARFLTNAARASRQRSIAEAYECGGTSRSVAEQFGLSDSHVRWILRLYGVNRKAGRPR